VCNSFWCDLLNSLGKIHIMNVFSKKETISRRWESFQPLVKSQITTSKRSRSWPSFYNKNIYTIAFIWRENMLGYLSADIIRSEKRTVFRERSSRKTVSFEEQTMSKDKYRSIFSQPNWGYCVYYPSVLKIGEYPRIFPSFSWGIFAHVTRLDQSRVGENIWWIINAVKCISKDH